jgi:hypothetical protein
VGQRRSLKAEKRGPRAIVQQSVAQMPRSGTAAAIWDSGWIGRRPSSLSLDCNDKLKSLISSPQETTLPTRQLLLVARNFAYRHAVEGEENKWFRPSASHTFPISPDTFLQPLENDGWPEAIDIARAILILHPFLSTFRGPHKNVADAAKRLVERSFKLRVRERSLASRSFSRFARAARSPAQSGLRISS